jgi:hypothetical protein
MELGCHEVTVCCSTIQCIPERYSTGGSGGAGTGGGGGSGGDLPAEAGVECNPELEHNRNYLGDPDRCLLIDYTCASPTMSFYNACGCGCEQDATCPETFDCRAGARIAPKLACTPENLARCPFSAVDE